MPKSPFESCAPVLKIMNPEDAKSDRQEKMIVAESFGNLILAEHLNLIQSKLSFQESS